MNLRAILIHLSRLSRKDHFNLNSFFLRAPGSKLMTLDFVPSSSSFNELMTAEVVSFGQIK